MKRQRVKFPWDLYLENKTYKLKRSIVYPWREGIIYDINIVQKDNNNCLQYLWSPDFKCKPSTFWLIIYLTKFSCTSLSKAMCVRDGLASSNVVSIWGANPFSSKVQTPFGPLKSGIPAAVLTPAPVWITMYFDSRKSCIKSAIFTSSCSGESKTYRLKKQ